MHTHKNSEGRGIGQRKNLPGAVRGTRYEIMMHGENPCTWFYEHNYYKQVPCNSDYMTTDDNDRIENTPSFYRKGGSVGRVEDQVNKLVVPLQANIVNCISVLCFSRLVSD